MVMGITLKIVISWIKFLKCLKHVTGIIIIYFEELLTDVELFDISVINN